LPSTISKRIEVKSHFEAFFCGDPAMPPRHFPMSKQMCMSFSEAKIKIKKMKTWLVGAKKEPIMSF
jgi:hypothetical protein